MLLPVEDPAATPHPFGGDTIMRTTPSGTVELSACHATFAVALMSSRVFSTAAAADVSARDRIEETLSILPYIRERLVARGLAVNERLLDELQDAYTDGNFVLRTYLTSRCRLSPAYRRWHCLRRPQRCLAGSPPASLHLGHRDRHHRLLQPRFGRGCAAFTDTALSTRPSPAEMAMAFWHLHLPGLLFTKDVDELGQEEENLAIINGDDLYECRGEEPLAKAPCRPRRQGGVVAHSQSAVLRR